MFEYLKRTLCKRCVFFNHNCEEKQCNHYHMYQSIIDRKGALYAVEILSRPVVNIKSSIEQYFDALEADEGKKLIKHQLKNILQSLTSLDIGTKKLFLNVDRYLMLDQQIVDTLIASSKKIRLNGWEIIFEITERQYNTGPGLRTTFYRMIVNDVLFAADDYSSIKNTHKYINDYTYVKMDMNDIKQAAQRDVNAFTDELYQMKENGVKLIAEKVQSKSDFLLVYSMPFDFFQGFHFDGQ